MIETLLQDISQKLETIELECMERGAIQHDTYTMSMKNYGYITDDNGLYNRIYHGIQTVNLAFMPLFHDMSLQISKEHILQTINNDLGSNINLNYGTYAANLLRVSNFTCDFKGNGICAQAKWRLENSNNGDIIEFFIRLYIKQFAEGNKVRTAPIKSLIFLNDELKEIDPFRTLPIADRSQLRKEANLRFCQIAENITLEIPPSELNGQDLSFMPAEFIFDDSIYIYSRSKKRGKIRYPLFQREPFLGYRFILSIRKEHIVPILSDIVRSMDAELISANFAHGRIELESYGSKSRSILHITVKGKVWIKHNVTLTASFKNLNYRATWAYWKYSIKAEWCWPICDKVIDNATDVVMEVIDSKKYFNGTIPSSLPGNFRSRINPEALLFYFNEPKV